MFATSRSSYPFAGAAMLASVLALFAEPQLAASQSVKPIVPYMQERLGITEQQVRAGLGALLIFSRERLPKPQFDQLARRMPNAEGLMNDAHLRGVVTGPLDDRDEYEAALANVGMAQQLAAQFTPVVVEYLGNAGYYEERDVLSRVLD